MRGWIVVALLVPACGSERNAPTPRVADAAPVEPAWAELAPVLFDGIVICRIVETGVESECPAEEALFQAFGEALRRDPNATEIVEQVAHDRLDHASAVVRTGAFQWADKDEDDPALARAIATETDRAALLAKLRVTPTNATQFPTIVAAILGHLEHPEPAVRRAAISALGYTYNSVHPTLFDRLVGLAERDPDPDVRADACLELGLLRDPRSVAVYARLLVAATPPRVFDGCAQGLVASWIADPGKEHPVEKAYPPTLRLLRRGPHRKGAPGVDTITAVRGVQDHHRSFDALAPWVDVGEVRAALEAFAASPRADPEARDLAREIVDELELGIGWQR